LCLVERRLRELGIEPDQFLAGGHSIALLRGHEVHEAGGFGAKLDRDRRFDLAGHQQHVLHGQQLRGMHLFPERSCRRLRHQPAIDAVAARTQNHEDHQEADRPFQQSSEHLAVTT